MVFRDQKDLCIFKSEVKELLIGLQESHEVNIGVSTFRS